MNLISDKILIDSGQQSPTHPAIYPTFDGDKFWGPSAWTNGHPADLDKKIREDSPVMWTNTNKAPSGLWSMTKYDDINEAKLAHCIFSSQHGSINRAAPTRKQGHPEKLAPAAFNSLINFDEPLHREMQMLQRDFSFPAYVEALRDKVGLRIDEQLDEIERQAAGVDFVKLFFEQLPRFTLCEMLGIDEQDQPKVKIWIYHLALASQFLSNPWETLFSEPPLLLRLNWVVNSMFVCREQVIAARRAEQRAMVLDDPSLIPQRSEKALRIASPMLHMRQAATDTINMHRDNVEKHIAIGHGVQKCLGSRIAKRQLRMAFERIFDRLPNNHGTGKQEIAPNALVHAISSLPVKLSRPDGKRPIKVAVSKSTEPAKA